MNRKRKSPGDRIEVHFGGMGHHWSVEIDLEMGMTGGRFGKDAWEPLPIPAETPETLAACARQAHTRGDFTFREQFPLGAAIFRLTIGGRTITLNYDDTGGTPPFDRVMDIWNFAWETLKRQRSSPGHQDLA
jgi:hypothetical protein